MAVTGRKIIRFVRMDSDQRNLILEAAFCLAVARLWLLVLPFGAVARRLGRLVEPASELSPPGPSEKGAEASLAWFVGQAIQRTARNVPFRAVCLQQAIAGKMMLRRRGIDSVLHFGVAPASSSGTKIEAHAWLNAGSTRVTGYPVEARFIQVACFI